MGSPTIFSCRRIVLKVFLLQFIAFQATYAAPSPIIRFPGDDTTPKTDKEVALVSLFFLKKKKKKSVLFLKKSQTTVEYQFVLLKL